MLNYVRAELYRTLHRKAVYVLLGLLLAGELLACIGWDKWPGGAFLDIVGILAVLLPVGTYLTILLTHFTLSDPYRHATLKNEVSFGLTRWQIYLGKLLSAFLVCLLVCGVATGLYLGGNWLLCAHTSPEEDQLALLLAGYALLDNLSMWLGMLGLSVLFLMNLRSSTMGVILLPLSMTLLPLGFGILTAFTLPGFRTLGEWGLRLTLFGVNNLLRISSTAVMGDVDILNAGVLRQDWLLGISWFAGSTVLGLLLFRRKEL